jgi:hypothetical protein
VIGTLMASLTWLMPELMPELMSLSRCYWLIAAALARGRRSPRQARPACAEQERAQPAAGKTGVCGTGAGSARGRQDRRVRNRSGLSSRQA